MLLTNRFRLFDKKGYSLNPDYTNPINVDVVQPTEAVGNGAVINAYTDDSTSIIYVEILSGGVDYKSDCYLVFTDVYTGAKWTTSPSDLTLDVNGTITSFVLPSSVNNTRFTYPAVTFFINQFLEPVSTGLISTDHLFLVENVFDTNGNEEYVYPRVDEYGPFNIVEYGANGTAGYIQIETVPITGSSSSNEPTLITGVSPVTISLLSVGMYVTGTGIPVATTITEVNSTYNYIVLSDSITAFGSMSVDAYVPHNLREGNTIRIYDSLGTTQIDGRHAITSVTTTKIFFASTLTIPTTSTSTLKFGVVPIYRAYLSPTSDEEFFLFTVTYNQDYPTISKTTEIYFELDDASLASTPDSLPTGNTVYQRTVYDYLHKEALQINIGLQSDYEGVYAAQLNIEDITYPETKRLFLGLYEGETVAEDERFSNLLQNFGRDVTPEEELILRESNVYEDNPDFILLNAKRKEMLLEGDNIWPYVGSYKGLVNIVNWFGYYDIRIKEYWLNVNQEDVYYNKYRQMQIPFQLKDKGKQSEMITLLPSKHYKKTNLFGLFYDLVKDGGTYDEYGVPVTIDAFEYSNEEILIKLFALKRFLKDKFLPLNTRIVDIVGEGVYYERYALNSWSDQNNLLDVNLTREIDFKVNKQEIQIVDIRPYDEADALMSPPYFDTISNYAYKYNINKVLLTVPGGPYYGVIPTLSFPGQALQQARGIVKMKGYATPSIIPSTFTGSDYQIGDIITLGGGVYENPIRITVVNVGLSGDVTEFAILAGPDQGSEYSSVPPSFFQTAVFRISGSQYVSANATGFTCISTDIPLQAESIYLYDKGLKYSTLPSIVFTPVIGGISATLDLETVGSTPSSYYNDGGIVPKYSDSSNIPVGAPLELSTSFDITWDEVPYRWQDLGGGSDATLRSIVDALPAGTGQLLAVEILSTGEGYRYTPTLKVSGGGGYGATAAGEIKNGQLKILEYTVTNVSSNIGTNDVLTLSPALPVGGINAVSTNRIVKADGITGDVITSLVNVPFSEIYLSSPTGAAISTTVAIGDVIKIHQGAYVTANGNAYTSEPNISPNGGHVGSIYTWDELGRGDMYQMEWRVTLTQPEQPTQQFNYFSGINTIDALINHSVYLPYAGKYTAELIVYDTDNNYTNEIKTDYIKAFLPDATFSYITRYISDCAETWDEFYQQPLPEFEPSLNVLAPAPVEGIRYNWENANGRWVNPVFTDSTWDSSQVNWNHLEVGNLTVINNYSLPPANLLDVIQISSEDNLEGYIISYKDSSTTPSAINPTITVFGQRPRPEIDPAINPNDWIYIRRDGVIYQLEVLSADYSVLGETVIELTSTPPLAFTSSPTSWEVLREIGGTVILSGDQIYNSVTNPNGIRIGEYIRLTGTDNTPRKKRIGINAKDTYTGYPNAIILNGGGGDSDYYKGGELGQIYKFRGSNASNGNLNWNTAPYFSTWAIEPSSSNDPQVNDHIGKIYILDAIDSMGCFPALPSTELIPGFSIITLYVSVGGGIVYEQRLRVVHAHFDTSTTGIPFSIWGGSPTGYSGIHVIDVVALDGGSLFNLNSYLTSQFALGASIWIEYEYEIFPARTYLGIDNSGDAEIYMDFNMYPSSNEFNTADMSQFPANALPDTGWYYDHGIASGDYSLYVTNTGYWRNGLGTIVTVSDTQSELLRSSSSFKASQLNFDGDAAETKLGSLVQTWENSRAIKWTEACSHSWNSIDYQNSLACNFRITDVNQNASIQFNNDNPFYFQGIVGGMSNAEKFSQALYELNKNDNTGLSRFDYQLGSLTNDLYYITGQLDTYNYPNDILNYYTTSAIPVAGDVISGKYIAPASKVTSVGANITLNTPLPKKTNFVGSIEAGSHYIRNIKGLLVSDIYVGEIITGMYLPVSPSTPAQVLELVVFEGHVRQIKLSQPASAQMVNGYFDIEWYTPGTNAVSLQLLLENGTFQIDAFAKTPSTDLLGWLTGQNGVTFYDWIKKTSTAISHTYPVKNVTESFGYGIGKVGAFQGGLNEFLMNERSLQIYYYEGLNPLGGTRGWYPAQNLPPYYSYITNDPLPQPPCIDNVSEAEVQSNRLPYESAIGGSWRWEETYINVLPSKLPSGVSVLLSSDASKIAGKTNFFWKLKENNDNVIAEITNSTFMWTFNQTGKYTVELEIADTNGNKKSYVKKDFFEIYEAN